MPRLFLLRHRFLQLCGIVAVLGRLAGAVQPNYWDWLYGSHNVTGAPCVGEIDLRRSFPNLSHGMRATFMTDFRLNKTERFHYYSTYRTCKSSSTWQPPKGLRVGSLKLNVEAKDDSDSLSLDICKERYETPTIVVAREPPVHHYGHQFITIVPALSALKLHLAAHGIDASKFQVLLVDFFGPYQSSTPANTRTMLSSLGFSKWIRACPTCKDPYQGSNEGMAICVDKAIILSFQMYGLFYHDKDMMKKVIWQKPKSLMDTDPVMMNIVESVRAHVGLSPDLPFAPIDIQTIVVASRSPKSRDSDPTVGGATRQKRALLNEDELVEELKKLPNVVVHQVNFGTIPFNDMLLLLANTSLLLGYHGSALENVPFQARGGWMLEIMPLGSRQPPLYYNKALVTGKYAVRWYNDEPEQESCHAAQPQCLPHDRSLKVNIEKVMERVETILKMQRWQLTQRISWYA